MEKKNLVSIIVTTKNEEKNIENCLLSIKSQTYKPIEIIIVDNFSTDRTKEIAVKYTNLVYEKGPERSAQRNYGMIEKSSGEYLMYVDADMILSPSLLEGCVMAFQNNPEWVALHIPEVILGKNFWSKVRRFERFFYNGTVIDGARFFRKEFFLKTGGFDLSFSGVEDWDMDKMIKKFGKIGLLSFRENIPEKSSLHSFLTRHGIKPSRYGACIYHNESEFLLTKYLKKKKYYAETFSPYIEKWGKSDQDLKKQFGFLYRYFIVFLENGKWKRLLMHPILTTGMYFLRILVGLMLLLSKTKRSPHAH